MNQLVFLIQSLIDLETEAWYNQDADTLVSLFHPDMVWPWPQNEFQHDPAHWVFPQGRYHKDRWKQKWENLFQTYSMVHNNRLTVRIVLSEEGDGAFAVVDVDTLWRHRATDELMQWKGRACKGYTKVNNQWLLIYHTGLLDYSNKSSAA